MTLSSPITTEQAAPHSLDASLEASSSLRGLRFEMTDWPLFWRKAVSVFALALALVPLISWQAGIPALGYTVGLVLLHVGILGIYFYRVRFRELDASRRSLIARLFGLAFTTYLLTEASSFAEGDSLRVLAAKMAVVSLIHMVMLVLLMVRVRTQDAAVARPNSL